MTRSICARSQVKLIGEISAKIGLQFSQINEVVVAQYEKGVVITSPYKDKALMAI